MNNAAMEATLSNDAVTGKSWLSFSKKPSSEVCEALRGLGWRYSGRREAWYHSRKLAPVPDCVKATRGELVRHSAERADMLEERAGRREKAGAQRLESAHALGAQIPFGQPILVGHHSEGRARRDAERIGSAMEKGVALMAEAESLVARAAGSELRQRQHTNPYVARRRLQRLEKEAAQPHLTADARTLLAQQIAEAKEAASQPIPADSLVPKPGDMARVGTWLVLIVKVNAKTLECVNLERGVWGTDGKKERSELRQILSSGHPLPHYMASAQTSSGLHYCTHQHASRREAHACAAATWPQVHRAYRACRLVMPEGLPTPK